MNDRVILVAGMGTSPAVLTETVWALAHQEKPVVPDEVIVLTTKTGKDRLRAELLSGAPSVWERLKAALRKEGTTIDGKLVFGETSIHVIPDANGNEAGDLRTGADNLRAADFMLGELRKYTESPDTVVLASIAGGRKTMSALLFSCMTLLGREQDRVYHVLIPPEYECGMEPPFYFPQKGVTHQLLSRGQPTEAIATPLQLADATSASLPKNARFTRLWEGRACRDRAIASTGKKVSSAKIAIELFEVPFVRMRGWYQEKFKTIPPGYRTLISRVQTVAPPAMNYPEIEIDAWDGWVKVNGGVVPMSKTCFAVLLLLADGCAAKDLYEKLRALHSLQGVKCDWLETFQGGERFNEHSSVEAVSKTMSDLRKKLMNAGFVNADTLVPQRGRPVLFPLAGIKWHHREKLADVCGHLFSSAHDSNGVKYTP